MIDLIDMDLIVYQIGSVCDNRYWDYKGNRYTSKKELNIILKQDGVDDSMATAGVDPTTPLVCRQRTCAYVEGIIEDSEDFQGHLSGKSNFRYDIATIQPYKGNRSGFEKPFHYDNVRQTLVDYYNAIISVNMEADDALGLAQTEDTCIVSIDKDLDCVPGKHRNWVTGESYEVSLVDANRNHFKQLLTGDSTDNILGLYNVGPKSEYVKNLQKMEDPEEMYNHVKKQYEVRFGSYWKLFMLENSKLLWILQKRKNPVEVLLG